MVERPIRPEMTIPLKRKKLQKSANHEQGLLFELFHPINNKKLELITRVITSITETNIFKEAITQYYLK